MLKDILDSLNNNNVFLSGGAGVGKTYLSSQIIKFYRNNSKNVVVLASTGIAAVNLGGQSIHSFFKFRICRNLQELVDLDKKQKPDLNRLKNIIQKCHLLVIDEVSMIDANLMDMILFRLNSCNFEGRILAVGDFYQLSPIKKSDNNGLLDSSYYAFHSSAWHYFKFKNYELRLSKRTKDQEFYFYISNLRLGKINNSMISYFKSFCVDKLDRYSDKSVLFGKNIDVDELNKFRLNLLPGEIHIFKAIGEIYDKNFNSDMFNKWKSNLITPDYLEIKKNAKIIFTINKKDEYYNGEQGIILDFDEDTIKINKNNGVLIELKRHSFEFLEFIEDDGEIRPNVKAIFSQFPIKLAYGITIHKSQGMSLESMICDVNNIFANGQLYVAISRAINPKNLEIYYNKYNDFGRYLITKSFVDNLVVDFYNKNEFIREVV